MKRWIYVKLKEKLVYKNVNNDFHDFEFRPRTDVKFDSCYKLGICTLQYK